MLKLFALVIAVFVLPLFAEAQLLQPSRGEDDIALARQFVESLAKEDFANATKGFDAAMQGAMPEAKLQQTWKSLLGQVGAFKKQVNTRTEKFRQYNVVFVACEFEKTPLDVKVVFNTKKEIAGLFFVPSQTPSAHTFAPPSYAKTNMYHEKEIVVGSGEFSLPGTLTLPIGSGLFPAVVLVHGSGPNDRDETVGPNKPFRDIALGLASRGIAVLRYEKRTKVYGAKLVARKDSITVNEETIDDALAAVLSLSRTENINPQKIFVLGHSLGGTVIPRIGVRNPNIAGFICLAGATRPFEDLIVDQMTYIFSLDNTISNEEKTELEQIKAKVARVKDKKLSLSTFSTELPLGVNAKYWLDLRDYNPAETATKLTQPMLFLQGGRDYQVTIADFDGWKRTLSSKTNVEFKLYPNLNHLFIEGERKSTPEEYQIAGHVAEPVIDDVAKWVKKW